MRAQWKIAVRVKYILFAAIGSQVKACPELAKDLKSKVISALAAMPCALWAVCYAPCASRLKLIAGRTSAGERPKLCQHQNV
jgi:hypothetical protein